MSEVLEGGAVAWASKLREGRSDLKRGEFASLEERIVSVGAGDLRWDWDGKCSLSFSLGNGRSEEVYNVDPTPGYSHDRELVRLVAGRCEAVFPTLMPTVYGVLGFDDTSRTNGLASKEVDYRGDGTPKPYVGVVTLLGKRIPLHPGMTRYLVAHEYGHIADFHLCHVLGLEANGLDVDYARMRGIECDSRYGPGRWHTNIGEVIANDFRIVVAGVEREFWPHPYAHPLSVPGVWDWWQGMSKHCPEPVLRDWSWDRGSDLLLKAW